MKYHQLGGLKPQKCASSPSSRAGSLIKSVWKSCSFWNSYKSKAFLASGFLCQCMPCYDCVILDLCPPLQMSVFSCVSLFASSSLWVCVQISPSYKGHELKKVGPLLSCSMTSSYLIISAVTLFSNRVTVGGTGFKISVYLLEVGVKGDNGRQHITVTSKHQKSSTVV